MTERDCRWARLDVRPLSPKDGMGGSRGRESAFENRARSWNCFHRPRRVFGCVLVPLPVLDRTSPSSSSCHVPVPRTPCSTRAPTRNRPLREARGITTKAAKLAKTGNVVGVTITPVVNPVVTSASPAPVVTQPTTPNGRSQVSRSARSTKRWPSGGLCSARSSLRNERQSRQHPHDVALTGREPSGPVLNRACSAPAATSSATPMSCDVDSPSSPPRSSRRRYSMRKRATA